VNDQIRPWRDNGVSSNSSPEQDGLRQKPEAFGNHTVAQVVHRLPSNAGSTPVVNQPSIAGTRSRTLDPESDTPSDYTPGMAPIVPPGQLVYGIQLPVQAQSTYFVEPWEGDAGATEVLAVAAAADRSGFFYVAVCDHVAIPDDLAPRMGAVWWDPIATLAWLAGRTTDTLLLSSVFNLNYRHPLVAAKAFATLDLLSGGRAIIGVGAGHVEGEFAALGVDFASRGRLLEWSLETLDHALREGEFEGVRIAPRGVREPRPPIWIGGAAPAAVKRAARLADGWLPQGTPIDRMPPLVEEFRRERGDETGDIGAITDWLYVGEPAWDVGRPCVSGPPEKVAEALRAWRAVGVNHLQVRFPSRDVQELVDQVERFGAEVGPLLGP
jgi:probable F420-dependent oxidoreductase